MLKQFKLFDSLNNVDCIKLIPLFNKAYFTRKQNIVLAEANQDYIYFVRSGRVKVSYFSPEGKEITVFILKAGDIYSLHSEAIITALDAVEILYISSKDFIQIIQQYPQISVALIKILGNLLKDTNDALLNLAFKEVNSRLVNLLLKMATEKGHISADGISFYLDLTHEQIANIISSTRQTVTTVLLRLQKADIICIDKKKLTVKNMDKLKELS